jgi:hypothetical protein
MYLKLQNCNPNSRCSFDFEPAASRMKEVCTKHLTKSSESLIKSVCYPGENKFTNAATRWGCDHEKNLYFNSSNSRLNESLLQRSVSTAGNCFDNGAGIY